MKKIFSTMLFVAASTSPAFSADEQSTCSNNDGVTVSCDPAALASGLMAFIDPDTGELLTGESAAVAYQDEARSAFVDEMASQMREAYSSDGLTEERTETGAVAVDLQGRFQSPLVAEIGLDGAITTYHMDVPITD